MGLVGRILVVDDDAGDRALVRACLQPGHTVLEAGDGREALNLVAHEAIDLVLLDVMMPGMSGFDVCRELKRRGEGKLLLPIILLTALGEQVDRNTGLEAGADDYLTKPVDQDELRVRVDAFLRLREQDRVARKEVEDLAQLDALEDDLVSLMVQDLRKPLSSILSLLRVIQEGVPDPRLKSDAATASAAAARIQEYLDDVRRIRLLEDEDVALDLRPYPIAQIVEEAVASIAPAAKERGVDLVPMVTGEQVVPLDRKLVRRAIENLLSNAMKYSPRHAKIEVEVRPEGGGVEIAVADRGPGVPDALREKLFERFGSIEAASGRARRGHGLGLYLVKLVACAHGGRVVARGRDGGGSVVGLWLPASRSVR